MSYAHLIMSVANNGEQAQYKSAAILSAACSYIVEPSSIDKLPCPIAQDPLYRLQMAYPLQVMALWLYSPVPPVYR